MSWFDNLKPRWIGGNARAMRANADQLAVSSTIASSPRALAKTTTKLSFPRFHATAADQLDTSLADRVSSARLKLRGAFTPSQPVTDRRLFAGHRGTLTSLIRAIEDERLHTIIYGERGIGKTSILHVLTQAARESRYLVAYVSCGSSSTFDSTFRTVADCIPLMFHNDFGPTSSAAEKGESFTKLLPHSALTVPQASELLAHISGTRLLIVLDEFDRTESIDFRRDIAEFLKNLSDRSVRVQLVIAGVADNFSELIEYRPSISRNIFALQAPKMDEVELGELLKKGGEAAGLSFDDNASRYIISAANGTPYIASLLCQHAGLVAVEDGRTVVLHNDVSAAVSEALRQFNSRMSRRARLYLAAAIRDGVHMFLGPLAGIAQHNGGQFNREDITATFPAPEEAARCRAAIDRLVAEDTMIQIIVDEFGRHFRFADYGVPTYLWLHAIRDLIDRDQNFLAAALT